MRKTAAGKIAAFACCVIIMAGLAGCTNNASMSIITGASSQDAVLLYLNIERGIEAVAEDLDELILTDFVKGKNHYYVIKEFQENDNKKSPIVYVLSTIKAGKLYQCTKVTADFSLVSNDYIDGEQYAPYPEWSIPFNGLNLHVGTIFDSDKDISEIDTKALPVKIMLASYAYEISDKRVAVGAADYVFIGKVLKNDGVIYKNFVSIEDKAGKLIEVGDPYTYYTVQVLENMKGELRTEKPIKIVKGGGIAQNGEAVYLYEDDCLPQAGQEYIFLAYAQEDGSLLVSGMGSNVPVEMNGRPAKCAVGNEDSEDLYEAYKSAVKNEIVPEGCRRDTSVYDAKENKRR